MQHQAIHEFFATAIPNTARVLADELRELGFQSIRPNRSGVLFRGSWEEGWRACLESRLAERVQLVLARFRAPTAAALYSGVQRVDWTTFITPAHTIAVGATCAGSSIRHSGFAALKSKDAIVDRVRAEDTRQRRPKVSKEDPDVRVFLYLANDKATIYLDLAGEALHRRGYRQAAGAAPLRETLAATMLRLSGWDRTTPFLDPMCGSGTIAIEAALWAANRAPGLGRERFGFERWANFDTAKAERLRELRGRLRRAIRGQTPKVQAADIDGEVLALARRTPGLPEFGSPSGRRLFSTPQVTRDNAAWWYRIRRMTNGLPPGPSCGVELPRQSAGCMAAGWLC